MVPNKRGQQNTQRKFALKSKYRPSRSLMLSVIKIEDQILPIRITAKEKKLSVKEQSWRQKNKTRKKRRSRQNNKVCGKRKECLRQKEMAHGKNNKGRDCEP